MSDFVDRLMERPLLCDGAMGTMLQAAGLPAGACPEALNLQSPDTVRAVHAAYVQAGADLIETNTFGANAVKLGAFGLEHEVERINAAAVDIAREAAGGRSLVAGSMGPTGRFLEPVGDMTFDEAVEVFGRQAAALAEAGADLVILETFSDIKEARAALIAARTASDLPVVALMTFEPSGLTLLGGSPEASAVTLEAAGASLVGANCGLGPEGMLDIIRRMAAVTELPLAAMPNAGMPRLEGGKTVFPAGPEEMARPMGEFLDLGAGLMGGCCGSTPAHIRLMREKIVSAARVPDRALSDPSATRLSSRRSVLFLGGASPLLVVGERLNPTGRKSLAASVRAGDFGPYRKEASRQADAGAHMLDVNVGVPGIDEAGAMREAVLAVQQSVPLPLSVDSPRPEVLEAGLKAADGKVLLNSVTGERESLEKVLPLAVRYGAAVLGLTLDGKGIPPTARGRLAAARRILKAARRAGLPDRDLVIDCLTLSAGAQQEAVAESLAAVSLVREKLGLNTILGVSNVSFGLPAREHLNAAFLAMAASRGLSAAIVNPFSETIMGVMAASRVIMNQDRQARDYIRLHSGGGTRESPADDANPEAALTAAVVEGRPEAAGALSRRLLEDGVDPMRIGDGILIPAMSEVGERFARNEYFLPQVLMSARAMKAAFEPVREALSGLDMPSRGRIVMATVEGDIHDIGKNIVITLLENRGFKVVDLGKNVPAHRIAEAAAREGAQAVGLSALMTTTMVRLAEAVHSIREAGLDIPVVVGGAAVTREYAAEIGADGYAADATEAVEVFLQLMQEPPRVP